MELKDFLLIIFGAFIGALSFIVKDTYLGILKWNKNRNNFNNIAKSYSPIIKKLKDNITQKPGIVLELRASNKLFLCSYGGKKAEPIIDDESFDVNSFLANLYSCGFIYNMDLDTSTIATGNFSKLGNRTVKYVLSDIFIKQIKKYIV